MAKPKETDTSSNQQQNQQQEQPKPRNVLPDRALRQPGDDEAIGHLGPQD